MVGSPCRRLSRSPANPRVLRHAGYVSVLLLAAVLVSCEGPDPRRIRNPVLPSISPYTPAPLPKCQYPKKIRLPRWLPDDLPLPPGTYTKERLQSLEGYRRVLLVIPVTLDELTRHVLEVWPRNGWVLGRGDSEIGEVEDQFSKTPAFGAFRAQAVICDPGYALMYLIFTRNRAAPGPVTSPKGSPLVPSPAPTPTG